MPRMSHFLGVLIGISVFVLILGVVSFVTPFWVQISLLHISIGEGIAFTYVSTPLRFSYTSNDFSSLSTRYKIAELSFPFALIGIIASIVRIIQFQRHLKANPSGAGYVLRCQYQSLGFRLASFVLLLISLSVFTSEAVVRVRNGGIDLGVLKAILGDSFSHFGDSAKLDSPRKHPTSSSDDHHVFQRSINQGSLPVNFGGDHQSFFPQQDTNLGGFSSNFGDYKSLSGFPSDFGGDDKSLSGFGGGDKSLVVFPSNFGGEDKSLSGFPSNFGEDDKSLSEFPSNFGEDYKSLSGFPSSFGGDDKSLGGFSSNFGSDDKSLFPHSNTNQEESPTGFGSNDQFHDNTNQGGFPINFGEDHPTPSSDENINQGGVPINFDDGNQLLSLHINNNNIPSLISSKFDHVKISFGFSFYFGWATLFFELLAIVWHLVALRSTAKGPTGSDSVALMT